MNRRSFLASGVAASAAVAVNAAPAQTLAQEPAPFTLLTDADFGFAAQISLGHSYYRAGDPGKTCLNSQKKTGRFFGVLWGPPPPGGGGGPPRGVGGGGQNNKGGV